jgi:S-adenosylmethionine:tRNA ribosyltransferase-isomerase
MIRDMMKLNRVSIEEYNYELPEERIAQYPEKDRDGSKLLIYNNGIISQDHFNNIYKYIPSGSLLVFNNTRVIRARLLLRKGSGSMIEILCLEPYKPTDYQLSFISKEPVVWKCMVGNLKKWKNGPLRITFKIKTSNCTLTAHRTGTDGEDQTILFSWDNNEFSFGEVIEATGKIPLPPYVKREVTEEDSNWYQTIYSKAEGSVAAPTAGLHFTEKVLKDLVAREIKSVEITLHVGAGTFQPVRTDDIFEHDMHSEHFFADRDTIEMLLANHEKIISVGTTSLRTLESLYWLGVKLVQNAGNDVSELHIGQWEPYENEQKITLVESFRAIISYMKMKDISILRASTKIIIIPGYEFRVPHGIITNFHLPRSTLLLLVSAWTGGNWKKIYSYAMKNNFRFLSYGDSSLLLKE